MLNRTLRTWGSQRMADSSKNTLKAVLFWNIQVKWWENSLGQEIKSELTINLALISGRWQCYASFRVTLWSTFFTNLSCLWFRCTVSLTQCCSRQHNFTNKFRFGYFCVLGKVFQLQSVFWFNGKVRCTPTNEAEQNFLEGTKTVMELKKMTDMNQKLKNNGIN